MDRFLKIKADVADRPVQAKASKCVVKKYDTEYITFGFMETLLHSYPLKMSSGLLSVIISLYAFLAKGCKLAF